MCSCLIRNVYVWIIAVAYSKYVCDCFNVQPILSHQYNNFETLNDLYEQPSHAG